jgi:hypothetical protein
MSKYKEPPEYKNSGLGRIVEGLTDYETLREKGSGALFETKYNQIREQFENLRKSGIFNDVMNYMAGSQSYSQDFDFIAQRARKMGIETNVTTDNVYRQVAKQWSKGTDGNFHQDFKPPFLLATSHTPCPHAGYEAIGDRVVAFMEAYPNMRGQFAAMAKSPDLFINPHEVFPVSERDTLLARQFEAAVRKSGLDGMSQPVVATFLQHNPGILGLN